jgi:hypothetical protein
VGNVGEGTDAAGDAGGVNVAGGSVGVLVEGLGKGVSVNTGTEGSGSSVGVNELQPSIPESKKPATTARIKVPTIR